MTNLISRAIAGIGSLLKELQVKRFLAVVLVGFLVLTTNAAPERRSQAVTSKIDEVVHQNDSQRPKTTGEWNKEARETEGAPGERLQKIATESAEAVKDFGSLYPDTAQRSASGLQNNNTSPGKDLSNQRQR
ncbi:hypothetical protein BZZ01_14115 [Nostocales cyanobacterium HT-58-2]|nr:hypothetical protein BZZ01_14115 [Nostocales cyanobacterium HT-58-2]